MPSEPHCPEDALLRQLVQHQLPQPKTRAVVEHWRGCERCARAVALKVMKPEVAEDPHNRQRFLRAARATAAITHDQIVTIYQVGEDRGVPFLAMEFLQGEPLDHWLKRGRRPTVPQLLRLGRE